MKPILVTGIKPTGKIHLGNYVGVIRPSIDKISSFDCRFFIADYHALNSPISPSTLKIFSKEIATIWLSCGLWEKDCLLFRQSDIPEIMEMAILLSNFVLKSRLNGAHAYKALVAQNKSYQRSDDHGINAGLFLYPILMAADILSHNASFIPIGKDQIQHLEIAKEIAQAVNSHCKKEIFVLPKEILQNENCSMVLGTDGKKMSKSYQNTIDLMGTETSLKKQIQSILTTPQSVEEKKNPQNCIIFSLFSLFSSKKEIESFRDLYLQGGLGWGYAKNKLQEVLLRELSPIWKKYQELQNNQTTVEALLKKNAEITRNHISQNLYILKKSIGLL